MQRQTAKLVYITVAFGALLAGALGFYVLSGGTEASGNASQTVRVLAYSSFVNSWGPGPEIAKRFEARTGIKIVLQDSDDAGLLLQKLELFPSDVVLGFDQLLLADARAKVKWKTLPASKAKFAQADFVAFDWGPLAFVYREGEIRPPLNLDDLLDKRFEKKIALEDPRTSSPGLQFLFWVLDQKGVEGGFAYLAKLKPSIHSVGASWSAAYGVFQSGQAKLAFSYLTSPVYHWVNDSQKAYQSAVFPSGQPVQVEYAGVPESCQNCDHAVAFVQFLLEPEIQKLIMEKNYMLPVVDGVVEGTEFERLPTFHVLELKTLPDLLRDREALLRRWQTLGL